MPRNESDFSRGHFRLAPQRLVYSRLLDLGVGVKARQQPLRQTGAFGRGQTERPYFKNVNRVWHFALLIHRFRGGLDDEDDTPASCVNAVAWPNRSIASEASISIAPAMTSNQMVRLVASVCSAHSARV